VIGCQAALRFAKEVSLEQIELELDVRSLHQLLAQSENFAFPDWVELYHLVGKLRDWEAKERCSSAGADVNPHHRGAGFGANHDVPSLHAADPAAVEAGMAGLFLAVAQLLGALAEVDDKLQGRVRQEFSPV